MQKGIELHVVEYANARKVEFTHNGKKYHEKILEHNIVVMDYIKYIRSLYAMFDVEVKSVTYTN